MVVARCIHAARLTRRTSHLLVWVEMSSSLETACDNLPVAGAVRVEQA